MVELTKEDQKHFINIVAAFKKLTFTDITGQDVFVIVQSIARLQQIINLMNEGSGAPTNLVPIKGKKK